MALSVAAMSSAIRVAMLDPAVGAIDGPALTAFCDALATAIVQQLQTSAVVLPGTFEVSGQPVTGVGVIS